MASFFSWMYILTQVLIWCISVHNLKYLDKLIKSIEMKAKIKSKLYILIIFPYKFNVYSFDTHSKMEDKAQYSDNLKT